MVEPIVLTIYGGLKPWGSLEIENVVALGIFSRINDTLISYMDDHPVIGLDAIDGFECRMFAVVTDELIISPAVENGTM